MPTPTTGPAFTGDDHAGPQAAVQGMALTEIADRFGTPLCVYDVAALRAEWEEMHRRLPSHVDPAYVLGTNPNVSLCASIRSWCARAVVSDQTELTSALLSGFCADGIVLDGPLGAVGLVDAALQAGVSAFAVTDLVQARLLDEAATHADTAPAVIAGVDASRPADAERFLAALTRERFDRVRVIGVSVSTDHLSDELVDLTRTLLSHLTTVDAAARLVLVRPTTEPATAQGLAPLTELARVVIATGRAPLNKASTVLTRVVQTGRSGPCSVTLDCALPGNTTSRLLSTSHADPGEPAWSVHSSTDGAERATDLPVARVGDLVAHPGVGLVDLPLPVGQILSHGVPAEVIVVDGRAVSTRAAATTEHLLSRQRVVMAPAG